jgi:peptidyl-prolyl cis-trans isomerase B (cyclophilin B)
MRARPFSRPALVASALVLALGLTACGDDDSDSEAGDDTSSTPSDTSESSDTATESGAGECTYVPDGSGSVDLPPASPTVDGEVPVTLQTSVGAFGLQLDAANAPCTVADELTGTETYGPGSLAMANAGPDTNSSEFFIVYADTPLPPSYTVFGTIDDATLALVEEVASAGQDNSHPAGGGVPNTPVDIESATVG